MSGSGQRLADGEVTPALLAGRFSTYLKASFIYPARNQRVTTSAEEFLETFRALSDDERWVTIRFRSGELVVDETPLDASLPLAEWMLETFTKALICGVEVGPGLDSSTLAEFTEQVRASIRDRSLVFAKEWGDRRGLRPVDLLFTGGHLKEDDVGEEVGDGGRRGNASSTTGSTNPFLEGSAQSALLETMAGDQQVSERLAEMQGHLNRQLVDSRDLTQVDLLGEIIRNLPTEALTSPKLARQVMDQVLDMAESEVLDALQTGELDVDAGLSSLFLGIARKFFGTTPEIDTSDAESDQAPVGRPRDLAYTADLELLLEELDQLPIDDSIDLEKEDPAADTELFGIYLHTHRNAKDKDAIGMLEIEIEKQLVDPSAELLGVLDCYTDKCLAPEQEYEDSADRLTKLLIRTGQSHLFSRSDLLSADVVKFGFPENFLLFLDSLDESEASRRKLRDVCCGMTSDRVTNEKDALLLEGGILEPARLQSLLSLRSHEVLPFVSFVAQHGDSRILPMLVSFLRALEVPDAEGAALRALEDSRLSLGYLHDLCECLLTGIGSKKLREYSLYLLTQFIDEKADDAEFHDRRVYAIGELRFFNDEGTRDYLSVLASSGRLLKRGKTAKAIREAAANTLERLGGKKS